MPVPLVGQWLAKVAGLDDVFIHFGEQGVVPAARQGVAPLQDGVGHVPAPLHRAARVVDPGLVEVRRSGNDGHGLKMWRQRVLAGQGVLRGAKIALAGSGDAAIGPRLAGRPFNGVVAVKGFLE